MATTNGTEGAHSPYPLQLFSNFPLYTTRLVREKNFPFCGRIQVSSPTLILC